MCCNNATFWQFNGLCISYDFRDISSEQQNVTRSVGKLDNSQTTEKCLIKTSQMLQLQAVANQEKLAAAGKKPNKQHPKPFHLRLKLFLREIKLWVPAVYNSTCST